jgi:hypothetical protein
MTARTPRLAFLSTRVGALPILPGLARGLLDVCNGGRRCRS